MTHSTDFEVSHSDEAGVPHLTVRGEVDVATSPALQRSLAELVERRPELVVADLTEVSFIDSTGLGVLVDAVQSIRAGGGDLRLVVTQPQIIKLLELTGLDEVFSVASSARDAVTS